MAGVMVTLAEAVGHILAPPDDLHQANADELRADMSRLIREGPLMALAVLIELNAKDSNLAVLLALQCGILIGQEMSQP
jgi:hypothetical protein